MKTEKKSVRRINILLAVLLCTALIRFFGAGEAEAAGSNLDAAMSRYNVSEQHVITAVNYDRMVSALSRAGEAADASSKWIVYLSESSYSFEETVTVPENVILVAEANTNVKPEGSFPILIKAYGSVYGGVYDSAYKNQTTIKLLTEYSNHNGEIYKAAVTRSGYYGIVGQGSRNAVVDGCKVTKCKASGISIIRYSHMSRISNSNVSNNGTAAINLSSSDVDRIENCTLNNNVDKAVSTNTDGKNGCHIKVIKGCTIKKNQTNGVHIKPNCTLDNFVNNTLVGNDDGLTAAAITAEGIKGKSIIKNVSGNTFKTSKTLQIVAQGKGASITIKSNNKILKGKMYGALALNSGKITIKGSGNIFKGNQYGLGALHKGKIVVSGKKNIITGNRNHGLSAFNKAQIVIKGKGNQITGNKVTAVCCGTGAKVTLKNTKVKGALHTDGGKIIKK